MRAGNAFWLMGLGGVLLLLGALLPFLMVIHLLQSSFALNFLAYSASIVGMALGLAGIVRQRGIRGEDGE